MTSSGQGISSSRPRAAKKPTKASSTPLTRPSVTEVWTVLRTPASSFAPKQRAATTFAPSDIPTNRLTSRLMSAPLEPTAASAVLPANRPTTTTSAALKSSCRMLDAASGSENRMIFWSIGPLVRSPATEDRAMKILPPLKAFTQIFPSFSETKARNARKHGAITYYNTAKCKIQVMER